MNASDLVFFGWLGLAIVYAFFWVVVCLAEEDFLWGLWLGAHSAALVIFGVWAIT